MTVLTVTEVARLRKRPHRTQLRMGIYHPDVLFGAQINNASASAGDITIPYDNVYTGVYTDVKPGMTLYYFVYDGPMIGGEPFFSREGSAGRLRVRSITATEIVVAENNIPWADNEWIRIVRFVEPWPVYPRSVLNDTKVPTWYKDYDIVYTDQNEILDPVVIMGPNRATTVQGPFPDQTHCVGSAFFYFDGSGSYDLNAGGTIVSYEWHFYGRLTEVYTTATPGWLGYGIAGNYAVSLTVTNDQGKSSTGWRFIVVNAAIDAQCGDIRIKRPIRYWGTQNLSGNYQSGGWEGKIWFREEVGLDTIVDGALVIIYAALETYGDFVSEYESEDNGYIGGNYPNAGDIVFCGYIRDGSVELSADGSSVVTVGLTGLAGKLDKMEGFGVSMQSYADPGADVSVIPAWAQVKNMTVDLAMYHYLRWHTTIYLITDVNRNGTNELLKFADFEKGGMYQAIDRFLLSTILGHVCFDAQDTMWMERKLDIVPVGERTPGTIMSLTRSDWRDKISIIQRIEKETSYVEIGGYNYSGPTTDIDTPYISSAPSQVPGYEGRQVSVNGLVVLNQERTNQLAGDIYANLNKLYPQVSIPMVGNYRVFDIAPQQRLLVTVAQGDTNLEITWSAKSFIPRQITYNINNPAMTLLVDIQVEEESDGIHGVSGPYPPDDPCANGACDPPPCPCADPDCNCEPPPCTDCGVGGGDGNLVYVVTSDRIGRCRNYISGGSSNNWEDITGAVGTDANEFLYMCYDPYDQINIGWCLTYGALWRTLNLNDSPPSWSIVATTADLAGSSWFVKMTQPITEPGVVYVAGLTDGGAGSLLFGVLTNAHDITHLFTPSAGGPVAINLNGDSLPKGCRRVIAHPSDIGRVYLMQGPSNRKAAIFESINHGGTWSVLHDEGAFHKANDFDFNVSTDPAETGTVWYWYDISSGTGAADILRDNSHGGAGPYTHVFAGGPGGASDNILGTPLINVATNLGSDVMVISRAGAGNQSNVFRSTDGGDTWTNVSEVPPSSSGASYSFPVALGRWPGDPERVYLLWDSDNSDPRIMYSVDGGANFQDKTGDWVSVFGAAPNKPRFIVPVTVAV